jgi:hypothetical protein
MRFAKIQREGLQLNRIKCDYSLSNEKVTVILIIK